MQYSTVLLSLLAATGSFAAPTKRTTVDTGIEVRLGADTFFLHVPFAANSRQEKVLGPRFEDKKFSTIQILANDAAKPRCQVTGVDGKPIEAVRGANRDTTFSDGPGNEWTFDAEVQIRRIICDPLFEANNINVQFAPEGSTTDSAPVTASGSAVATDSTAASSGFNLI